MKMSFVTFVFVLVVYGLLLANISSGHRAIKNQVDQVRQEIHVLTEKVDRLQVNH